MKAEGYGLGFLGKESAMAGCELPMNGKIAAHCFDEGIYIKGDALDGLKYLKEEYAGRIQVVYIDPPYNTGSNLIYKDDFRDRTRTHDNWLCMMYPRLVCARALMAEDGVLFVSIGNFEYANTKLICDEIFGEDNFVDTFVWNKTETPPSLSKKTRQTVEFILCYEKCKNSNKYYGGAIGNGDAPLINTTNYAHSLSFPPHSIYFNFIKDGVIGKKAYSKAEVLNDIVVQDRLNTNVVTIRARFKWNQEKILEEIGSGTEFYVRTHKFSLRFKRGEAYGEKAFKPPYNFLSTMNGASTNEGAKRELKTLGMERWFDYPKPVSLIKLLINMVMYDRKDCIVLDYFSGSATTAQAVMELNAEDGGVRKFILMQTQEPLHVKSEAYKNGMRTICDIGMERIRRCEAKKQQCRL